MKPRLKKKDMPDDLKDLANSAWGFFIFNPRLAILLGLVFAVVGVYSFLGIPRESQPEVKIPFATVTTTYPGAAPKEVAEQITFKIEQKVKSLDNLEEITSSSSEGVSSIFVEFDAKADLKESIDELKDKVDEAVPGLPEEANEPAVREVNVSDEPIVIYSFFGNLPYEQLLLAAQDAQEALEQIKGIQSADISGERERHVLVAVRQQDMLQYNLNLRTISQAIRSFQLSSPVGNIKVDDFYYQVRITAEQETVEQVENIPIAVENGATIYVKDVANVTEERQEANTASLVSVNGEASKNAISIQIVKKTGANILETVAQAEEILRDLKSNGILPAEVDYLALNNQAEFIEKDFNNLSRNALGTVVLIFAILLLALGFKEALIGSISIPLTFFVTFAYLLQSGSSFNFLVLFSLILGLGLLVDATIVIMEGMHENIYLKNMPPTQAALNTIKTYRWPLISGMLTTVSAFLPMLLMSGILGEYFKFIPTTVTTVLVSSLLIGLFLIPAYSALLMHKKPSKKKRRGFRPIKWLQKKREQFIEWVNVHYKAFLHRMVTRRATRVKTMGVVLVAFASAIVLPMTGAVGLEGFPIVDVPFLTITAELPTGSALETLPPVVKKMEKEFQADPDIESYVVNLRGGQGGTKATATFNITLVDEEERERQSAQITEEYKEIFKTLPEAELTYSGSNSGPPVGATIQVLVFGEDYSILQEISQDLQENLEQFGGDQVRDDLDTGTAEFTFDFTDPTRKALLRNYGLTPTEVAQEVRTAVFPTTIATIKRGDEEIDIDLQREWGGSYPQSIDAINTLPIQSSTGQYVPLNTLAEPKVGASLPAVRNFDGKQAITISSDIAPNSREDQVLAELRPYLQNYPWPEGYSYLLTGGNEDTNQSFQDLGQAMLLAILLIFLILVTQFNSFKQPFVILMALPFSLIGVVYGFMALRLNLSVASMIGIVALSGIVINDAIVLIDRINTNRKEGMNLADAIQEAGPARLQPIIITSVTTVLGILPISLTDPFWLSLGMAIAFGMAFSTVLTLIIIPLLYYRFELRGERKRLEKENNFKNSSKDHKKLEEDDLPLPHELN